ncbi:MAG: DUF1592 domain-containing protein [Lentisphaeraceae bacterium]|nr:DUF1592 domain-containing protein [Lentisphaeraceae bacterium]
MKITYTFLSLFLLLYSVSHAQADKKYYQSKILPLLTKYCIDCHGEKKAKGKIRIDVLDHKFKEKTLFTWDKMHHVLDTDDDDFRMPPEVEKQPSRSDKKLLLKWIAANIRAAKKRNAELNGSVRRLTKEQYGNSLKDLLGLQEDFTRILPADAVSKNGFSTGDVMQVSPSQMEKYFSIARKALDAVIVDENSKPKVQNFRMNLGSAINPEKFTERLILGEANHLIPVKDFTIDELSPKKPFVYLPQPFQKKLTFVSYPGGVRRENTVNSIYHSVFACLRGKKGYLNDLDAEAMIPSGLLLRPSMLHLGTTTFGPTPNFKVALRQLPSHGNFRIKVKASKFDDVLLLTKDHPLYNGKKAPSKKHTVQKENNSISVPETGVYQLDLEYQCLKDKTNIELNIDKKSLPLSLASTIENFVDSVHIKGSPELVDNIIIQNQKNGQIINLAEIQVFSKGRNIMSAAKITSSSIEKNHSHEELRDGNKKTYFQTKFNNRPWIKLSFNKPVKIDSMRITNIPERKLQARIFKINVIFNKAKKKIYENPIKPLYRFTKKAFCLVHLKRGKHKLLVNSGQDSSIRKVFLSKLHAKSPLVAKYTKFKKRNPSLGVHIGFRRDCGSTYAQVNEAQKVSSTKPRHYYFKGAINNYPRTVATKISQNYIAGIREIAVRNEFLDGRDAPRLLIHSVEFEGPYYESWPPKAHKNIFIASKNKANKQKYAAQIIKNFIGKAFRRAPTEKEFKRIFAIWKDSFRQSRHFNKSIKNALAVVLCSPQFLLLSEKSYSPKAENLSEYELASKLSYFLWNRGPDKRLLDLAKNANLKSSINEEIDRMLKSKNSKNFITNFVYRWLDLEKALSVEINQKLYPSLTKYVKTNLINEPIEFIGFLIDRNLPLRNIIDSKFILANDVVAAHYKIKGHDSGLTFKAIKVPENRGGLLSQAAILAGLSDGRESNPV